MIGALVVSLSMFATEDVRTSSVGIPARIEGKVIDGLKVQAIPLGLKSPMVVRIADARPHGTAHRYDFEYYGLEPGSYDLRDYLQHEDGSPVTSIEPLAVQIDSKLPPGQIEPGGLGSETTGDLGGYRNLLIVGGVLWLIAGVGLFVVGRKKRAAQIAHPEGRPMTLAERLRPLVEKAVTGDLDQRQRSELEMTLVAYWRRKLGHDRMDPAELLSRLKQHEEAGPLMRGLEDWLHRPSPPREVDLEALLRPYESVEDAADLKQTA